MLIKKLLIIIFILTLAIIKIPIINTTSKNIFNTYTREELYIYTQKKIEENNLKDAKECLEFLLNGEQDTKKVMELTINFGTIFYKLEEYEDAKRVFSFFINDHTFMKNGTPEQIEYAYYMFVKCIFKLQKNTILKKLTFILTDIRTRDIKEIKIALELLKKIKKDYPQSKHLSYVKKHIKILKNHINYYNLHIIKYYKSTKNYKAAYERMLKLEKFKKGKITKEEKLMKDELMKKMN